MREREREKRKRRRNRVTRFQGKDKQFLVLKVSAKCPFVLVNVGWRKGKALRNERCKALGSEEGKALGSEEGKTL
jgi:hypothetical protein